MEPLAFALMFAYSISDSLMTDLIEYQTCKILKGVNASLCEILHHSNKSFVNETADLIRQVQQHIGPILTSKSCIELIFPTLLALFLGPWSDKNGRKPLLIFPFIGHVLYYAGYAILSTFNVNPYWFLLPSVPISLLGGFSPILLTFFCYITDFTNKDNRSWHLACLDTALSSGILVGFLVGPLIFKKCGYITVFSISSGITFLALLHVLFYVKETVVTDRKRTLTSVFNFPLVKELFTSVTKQRDGFDRGLVWSCIAYIAIHVIVMEGNASITFLFTNLHLQWSVIDYSIYAATGIFITISGMLLLIKFVGSVLKLPDVVVLTISCLSYGGSNMLKAFVKKPWQMYLCASIGMFGASAIPVIRSIISKAIPQKDIGKAFSVTTILEMLLPFATTPLYLYVYTHTLDVYPSPVWFLSGGLPVILLILAIIINKRWSTFKKTLYSPFVSVDSS
ncbi:proton-coupled folate transporter-like isoform X2 [Phymastichus coffea]|nr:proton-coupled folate transporter-like isoform X2 [Phymastichus coffea]XP_058793444.1 proton-coupled folate transporter-like isoform X2 [Phymastichus coffea]